MKKTKVYVVKKPQGDYDDYEEPIRYNDYCFQELFIEEHNID